jgi:hypothetical protein
MSKIRATAVSWQTKPMPEPRKELLLDGRYTTAEFVQMSMGYMPQDQQDKWFIYLEGEWLSFHRSWTGTCIFQLQLVAIEGGYQATKAIVNRDPDQYRNSDDVYDVSLMAYLIDHLLLGRFAPPPVPRTISQADRERHQQHVMGDEADGGLTLKVIGNGNE